jgi:hypothetical protein
MKNGLEQAYELVVENAKEGIVKTSLKAGQTAAGDLKRAKGVGPEATGVKAPTEGDSKINPGHGKIKTESRELSKMLPTSKFDDLFKQQIVVEGEFEGDESPVEMGGDAGFDDEEGDFPSETGDETGEEVDVATELRMCIDRLTEVATKLGAYDEDMEDAGEETGESEMEDDDLAPESQLAPESVQAKLAKFKDSSKKMQGPKSNNKVKSAFTASKKKANTGAGGPGKGAADGKLSPMKKTTFGPKMSQKATVQGTMGKVGAGVFDNV